jgi:glutamate synthase (NADPH/NADH) large chain
MGLQSRQGLYDPRLEHDACGVGFVANIKNVKSHGIVRQGLQILENLTHRGATGYDPLLGDGAGILIQTPDAFLRAEAGVLGISLPPIGRYGTGIVFLPRSANGRLACESVVARIVDQEGQRFLGWRDIPRDNSGLAKAARAIEPAMRQVFIGMGDDVDSQDAFERKLFVIRKRAEHAVKALALGDGDQFYMPSLSCAYGGVQGHAAGATKSATYYQRPAGQSRLVSALALVHQRFSTNTFPAPGTWRIPSGMTAHNGEINTLRGNVNWMARPPKARWPVRICWVADVDKLWPLDLSKGNRTRRVSTMRSNCW